MTQIRFFNFYNFSTFTTIDILFVEMIRFIITAPDSLSLFGEYVKINNITISINFRTTLTFKKSSL